MSALLTLLPVALGAFVALSLMVRFKRNLPVHLAVVLAAAVAAVALGGLEGMVLFGLVLVCELVLFGTGRMQVDIVR